MKTARLTITLALICGIALAIASSVRIANAQNTESTASADSEIQIKDLQDRLATKVAELADKSPKAFYGSVKSVSLTTLVMETATKDMKIELSDDIKAIRTTGGKRTAIEAEDIEPNDLVTVFGSYDQGLDLLEASVVIIQDEEPVRLAGTLESFDGEEYTLTVKNSDGIIYTVDYERTTQAYEWTRKNEIAKIGFSKITAGTPVFINGTPVPKSENRISAARLLQLTELEAGTSSSDTESTPSAQEGQ